MSIIIELSSKSYLDDKLGVKKTMSHMETACGTINGYSLGEPSEMAGWTFFKLKIHPELHQQIETKFADMLDKYRWSSPDEKFRRFMADYFSTKGCGVKIKITS